MQKYLTTEPNSVNSAQPRQPCLVFTLGCRMDFLRMERWQLLDPSRGHEKKRLQHTSISNMYVRTIHTCMQYFRAAVCSIPVIMREDSVPNPPSPSRKIQLGRQSW